MPRRYSDAPINLIARIPTPEQLSAARAIQLTFRERVTASCADFFRRLTEKGDRLTRFGRSRSAEGEASRHAPQISLESEDSLDQKPIERADVACEMAMMPTPLVSEPVVSVPVPPPAPLPEAPLPLAFTESEPVEPVESVVETVSTEELRMMRTELLTQRQELVRLSSQVHELQALVASQQQVLLYMGQEMEQLHMPALAAAVAPAPPKKPRVARAKTSATTGTRKAAQKPMLNL